MIYTSTYFCDLGNFRKLYARFGKEYMFDHFCIFGDVSRNSDKISSNLGVTMTNLLEKGAEKRDILKDEY